MPEIKHKALVLYDELNERGQAFVDNFATQIEDSYRRKSGGSNNIPFGPQSARILAVMLLACKWDGRIPEGWEL